MSSALVEEASMFSVFSKRFADGRTVIETVQVSFVPAMVTA